jgi:hypothetical protein
MTPLSALLLPIIAAAALVFVASSVIHMMLPWHHGDYLKLPKQDETMDLLRPLNIPPGDYMVPRPDTVGDMKTPAYQERVSKGPVIVMTVMPNGQMNMAKNMGGWFIYIVVVGIFAAYVAGRALPPGTDYLRVFRFAGVTAFAGYSLALAQMSIWYQRSWATTTRSMIDGLIYAGLTAGVYGAMWPK